MIKNQPLLFSLFLCHIQERDFSHLKLAFCIAVHNKVSVPHKGVTISPPKVPVTTVRAKEKPEIKPLGAKAISKTKVAKGACFTPLQ